MNPLNEQANAIISCDGSMKALRMIEASRNSSAVYWVCPPFPAATIRFKVGNAAKSGWTFSATMHYHPRRGLWRAYIPGRYFTARCETYYQIVALDEDDARTVLGVGILRVHSAPFADFNENIAPGSGGSSSGGSDSGGSGGSDSTVIQSAAAFAPFPDGTFRAVSITEDDMGAPVFTVSDTPVDAALFDTAPATLYAYNNATGFYHPVSAFQDDSGHCSLLLGESPADGGCDSFVLDPATNFYRRLEAVVDNAGALALSSPADSASKSGG